jgi:hypothetical protein
VIGFAELLGDSDANERASISVAGGGSHGGSRWNLIGDFGSDYLVRNQRSERLGRSVVPHAGRRLRVI